MKFNPLGLKGVAIVGVVCLSVGFGSCWKLRDWMAAEGKLKAARAETRQARHVVGVVTERAATTEKVGKDTAERVEVIRWRIRTITERIPTYVTPATDARFPLSVGFVRVYDASAQGLDVSAIPLPAGKSDGDASDITASVAALTLAGNNGACLSMRENYIGLQTWLRAMQKAPD